MDLLWEVAGVEIGITALLFAGVLVHALWLARVRRVRAGALDAARDALGTHLQGDAADNLEVVGRLRRREQVEVLGDLAAVLSGDQRDVLTAVAEDLDVVGRACRQCHHRAWHVRLAGVRLLALLGGGEDVVPTRLDDPHPEVRAEAIGWVVRHPGPHLATRLVAALDDPAPRCRFAAKDALVRLGAVAADAVLDALGGGRLDGRPLRDALDVAVWVADPRFLRVGLALRGHRDPAVAARAVALLGAVGGGEAAAALVEALGSTSPTVRAPAARALGRMGDWSTGAGIAALLDDRDWDVRRAAGLGLADLGAPGIVLLRRAAADAGPAADMAQRVLAARAVAAGDRRPATLPGDGRTPA